MIVTNCTDAIHLQTTGEYQIAEWYRDFSGSLDNSHLLFYHYLDIDIVHRLVGPQSCCVSQKNMFK